MAYFAAGRYLPPLPIGSNPVNSNAFMALAGEPVGSFFLNGLMLALPVIYIYPPAYISTALGLLNRMALQLSIFVIGFPLTLTVGALC